MKSRSDRKQNTACDACKLRKTKCSLSTWSGPGQELQEAICEGCRKRNIACTKALSEFKIPQKVYSTLNRLGDQGVNAGGSGRLQEPADSEQNKPLDVTPPPELLPQLDLSWLDVDLPGLPQLVPSVPFTLDQAAPGQLGQKGTEPVVKAGIDELELNPGLGALTEEETWTLLQLMSGLDQAGPRVDLVDPSWVANGISATDAAGPSGTSQNSWFSVPANQAWSGYDSVGDPSVAHGIESETTRPGPVDRRPGKRPFDQLDQSSSTDPDSTPACFNTNTNANASTSATSSSVGRSVWSNDWLDLTPPGRESKKPRTEASSLAPIDVGFQDQGNLLARTSERKELSRSLVNTYLAVFHAQYPLLDPHLLRRKFDAAGQDPERLAPAEQVTFACIEAWAARSSLHPAVLQAKKGGPLFIEQALSPERVDYVAMSPLPSERAAVGRSRIPVCRALKDRALRLLDTHSIMRKPSLEGLKSLLLLSNLMMGEIPKGWEEGQDAEMDREMLKSTIAEQIKLLHRHNRLATTDRADSQEAHRVVFAAWIQDAFTAATTGSEPLLPAGLLSEIAASIEQSGGSLQGAILPRVDSESRFHIAFRLGWIESGQVARYIAKFISQPSFGPDSDRDLDDFIEAVETAWRASADGLAALRSRCAEAMDLITSRFPATSVYQWIMTYVTQVVLLTSASCIVHGWITARRTAEQTRATGARIDNESAEFTPKDSPRFPGSDLERLYQRSAMEVLKSVVDFVPVLRSAIPLNLLQNPSPNLLTLTALAEAAISIPTEEQGLTVSILKGVRWRNTEKRATLAVYREALSQCTSAWSRVQDDVDALDSALSKMSLIREASGARDDTIERLLCCRLDM